MTICYNDVNEAALCVLHCMLSTTHSLLSCFSLSCLVLVCLVLFQFVLSCLSLSCLVLVCLVLSQFVLSTQFNNYSYYGECIGIEANQLCSLLAARTFAANSVTFGPLNPLSCQNSMSVPNPYRPLNYSSGSHHFATKHSTQVRRKEEK